MKITIYIIILILVSVVFIAGCIENTTKDNNQQSGFGHGVASIYISNNTLNYTEIRNINYTAVKIELEQRGYTIGTHINNTIPPPDLYSGENYVVALRYNDTNFTQNGKFAVYFGIFRNIDNGQYTSATMHYVPSGHYYYNETNLTKDTTYLRLKAKEVFQICNITADVDKWDLKVNLMD